MHAVESSNLDAIGFDPRSSRLYVRFRGGALYEYDDVPLDVFVRLCLAPSKGSALHGLVKSKGYEYRLLEEGSGNGRD